MHRLLKILILFILFYQTLLAKEPFLATLIKVVSNDIQVFKYGNTQFSCLPYGIVAIDELYRKADDDSVCKTSIEKFYAKRQDYKYYISNKLHVNQSYSIVFKEDNRCIINIAGEKPLAEFLIEKGLAVKKPLFRDKEYSYYFLRAEQKAKVNRVGIWKENTTKDCVAYIFSKD